ncbi:MAG: DnaJ domain-containing protein [Ruminococcus sp.]|nr:DnaJ domain-containing protein [Ruminococcus sp.]
MSIRTYYDVLGVSQEASPEEITNAKNALAKIYHPDANVQNHIDTTTDMQEILEAYQVLSNPEKRRAYDKTLNGRSTRVFRTFTVGEPDETEESFSFVTCWNAAAKLQDTVKKSSWLLSSVSKQKSLSEKILEKFGKNSRLEKELQAQLDELCQQALEYISILKDSEIPMDYWNPEAMNWVLVHWGQNQNANYLTLFAQYDAHVNRDKSGTERLRLRSQNRQFHHNLKKLLSYAL